MIGTVRNGQNLGSGEARTRSNICPAVDDGLEPSASGDISQVKASTGGHRSEPTTDLLRTTLTSSAGPLGPTQEEQDFIPVGEMVPTGGASRFISAPSLNHLPSPPPRGASELPKKGMTEDGPPQEWDAARSVMSAQPRLLPQVEALNFPRGHTPAAPWTPPTHTFPVGEHFSHASSSRSGERADRTG